MHWVPHVQKCIKEYVSRRKRDFCRHVQFISKQFKQTVREATKSDLGNNNDIKSFILKPFHPLVHFYIMYITEIRWTSLTLSLAYHPTAPVLPFKGH